MTMFVQRDTVWESIAFCLHSLISSIASTGNELASPAVAELQIAANVRTVWLH